MNHKEILLYQQITPTVILILEGLNSGEITRDKFHNRKAYAKRNRNLTKILEYSIAWEIFNFEKEV